MTEAEFLGNPPSPAQTNIVTRLEAHAELTIKRIESMFKRRGWTTGKKLWERELLRSAYEALGRAVPSELLKRRY
jgi:hypothetical protein